MVGTRWLRMVLCAGVMVAPGCGSASTAIPARSGDSASSTSATTVATDALRVSEADNGGTTTVPVGQKVIVTLAGTYWSVVPSDARVLAEDAPPRVLPGDPSCPRVPGTDCGTVVATFNALAPGQAELGADRTTCGEALRCSESQSHWHFDVRVSAPSTTTQLAQATTTSVVVRPTVPTSSTTPATVPLRSGVSGTVLFSPVCPVEHVPPDPQCAPRPGAAEVHLIRVDNGAVVDRLAGADGRFSIPAPPGTYVVKAAARVPSPGRGCSAEPSPVMVTAGSVASVSVTCDTGIR